MLYNLSNLINMFDGKIILKEDNSITVRFKYPIRDRCSLQSKDIIIDRLVYELDNDIPIIVTVYNIKNIIEKALVGGIYDNILSSEDIIDIGFTFVSEDDEYIRYTYEVDDRSIELIYNKEDGRIKLEEYTELIEYYVLYTGKCNTKFDLLQIMNNVITY